MQCTNKSNVWCKLNILNWISHFYIKYLPNWNYFILFNLIENFIFPVFHLPYSQLQGWTTYNISIYIINNLIYIFLNFFYYIYINTILWKEGISYRIWTILLKYLSPSHRISICDSWLVSNIFLLTKYHNRSTFLWSCNSHYITRKIPYSLFIIKLNKKISYLFHHYL